MMRRLSAACAGCYAAVQFHLFKPSDVLGDFLKCVGGNPAYVDATHEVLFIAVPRVMDIFRRMEKDPTFPRNMGDIR